MATSSDSYGTSTGVERLIGDIFVSRILSSTTVPTLTQVEFFIDDIASELNRELAAASFQVPVSTSANPLEARWLESINNYGAAAIILGSMPMTAISPGAEDAGSNRMAMYQIFFNNALTSIRDNRFTAARVRGRLGGVFSGSQNDIDGNRKKPIFTREDGHTPGIDSLIE
jgi:hypothetical protein